MKATWDEYLQTQLKNDKFRTAFQEELKELDTVLRPKSSKMPSPKASSGLHSRTAPVRHR